MPVWHRPANPTKPILSGCVTRFGNQVIDNSVTLATDRSVRLYQLAGSLAPAIADAVLDLLFPPCCVGCRQVGTWLCARCLAAAETIEPPLCPRCGLPHNSADHCALPATAPLGGIIACAFHSGSIREAIHQLKYQELSQLAVPLGRWMAERWPLLTPAGWTADMVVPVPLHPRRERQRGYNQSALLARELAAHLGLPAVTGALVRARATRPQVGLSPQQREVNVRDAFACAASNFAGKRVLLVDDVCTTGSTLTAACQALRAAGASSVWAFCVARAKTPGSDHARQPHFVGHAAGLP